MSRSGHAITAFALASVVVAVDPTLAGVLTGAGVLAGASIPDTLDGGPRGGIVPHRTLTHWLPIWITCAIIADHIPAPWSHLLFGVAISAALHIVIDAGSPMGCPGWNPWRRHPLRSPLYRTGTSSEFPIIFIALVVAGCAVLARGPAMTHLLRFI